MKRKVIIYGAGINGTAAFYALRLRDDVDILFFADRDEKKIGTYFFGRRIISPEDIRHYADSEIIVTCAEGTSEIKAYLRSIGCKNIVMQGESDFNRFSMARELIGELNTERCIDLGKFLLKCFPDGKIECGAMPYIEGGSGILDYAFLLAIAKQYNRKTYMEIGSYIGTTLNMMSGICDKCISLDYPWDEEDMRSMARWCKCQGIPDYSQRLATSSNIEFHYGNTHDFDYGKIKDKVDFYFIDGDHSYNGVYCDVKNIFSTRTEDSIIVWHDFRMVGLYDEVLLATADALGEEFKNVFVTDNNICGVYLPPKYQKELPLTIHKYYSKMEKRPLYLYDTTLNVHLQK